MVRLLSTPFLFWVVSEKSWELVASGKARKDLWVSKMADSMDVEDAERTTDSLPGIGELKAFTQVLRLSFQSRLSFYWFVFLVY